MKNVSYDLERIRVESEGKQEHIREWTMISVTRVGFVLLVDETNSDGSGDHLLRPSSCHAQQLQW